VRKRGHTTEHDTTERWLVSYADFITLLFAFFTTMYAISHVDIGKLEKFEGSMRSALKATGDSPHSLVIGGLRPLSPSDLQIEREIRLGLQKFDTIPEVKVSRSERGVIVSLGDALLFESGSASIREAAIAVLSSIASVIKTNNNDVVIEGYTDNIPIKNSRYPSNWELSTARAVSVLVYFLDRHQVNPSRVSASGYGEYRSIASNTTPEGRAKNRRVDIIFVSKTTRTQ
jgi:chemotaxis protein MotB